MHKKNISILFILLATFGISSLTSAGLKPEKLKEKISQINNHTQLTITPIDNFKIQNLNKKKRKETSRQLMNVENYKIQFFSEGVRNRRGMISEEKEFVVIDKKSFPIQENIPKLDLKSAKIYLISLNDKKWIYITGPSVGLLKEGKAESLNVNHLIELSGDKATHLVSFINHYLDIEALGSLNGQLSVFLFQSKYPENQKTTLEGMKFVLDSNRLVKDTSDPIKYTLDEYYYK